MIDLTDEIGIDSLKRYWIPRALEYATKPHVQAILIGNKYDIIDQVLSNENNEFEELKEKYEDYIQPKIHRLISKYKFPYFQMSAKTGYNVRHIFMTVTTAFLMNMVQTKANEAIKSAKNGSKNGKSKGRKSKRNSNRYYERESSFSREESITLDSKDYNFTKKSLEDAKTSGCC